MAVTWTVNVRPLDIVRKEVSVSATRTETDTTDPENVETKVETHTVLSAIIDTNAQKVAVMDQIWDMHLVEVEKQAQIAAVVADLEALAVANLEARE